MFFILVGGEEVRWLVWGVLGKDSGCEGSCQLGLFKVEMVAVYDGTILGGKLDLLLCLVLGKGASVASESRFEV